MAYLKCQPATYLTRICSSLQEVDYIAVRASISWTGLNPAIGAFGLHCRFVAGFSRYRIKICEFLKAYGGNRSVHAGPDGFLQYPAVFCRQLSVNGLNLRLLNGLIPVNCSTFIQAKGLQ